MKGAFDKFLCFWPQAIKHINKNEEKVIRYQVGEERLSFLKNNAERFAYKVEDDGTQIIAFLVELDQSDLDYRMPESTKFEYICGKILKSNCTIFSYIWFDSISEAKDYVKRKGMSIEGGWYGK